MKKSTFKKLASLALIAGMSLTAQAQEEDMATFRTWATTPPMGWNSWDCYFSSANEKIVMDQAKYIVDHNLDDYGWEYVVLDIRWYAKHPSLGGGWYNMRGDQECQLDEYGRYIPPASRFPSCMKDGKNIGFKAMADSIHAMGLKFGIHIMRGLPKYILESPSKYKLKGSENTPWSSVYKSTNPECGWLADNLTIQNNKYGQLYYNSIFDMYAEWGIDFIKIDDLSRPYYNEEIEMIRKAIDQTGRPIVLSLSPGKTQFQYAQHCLENANMWRMMDDLWDTWSGVDMVFREAAEWAKYSRPGNFADCDMLPLGQIAATVGDPGVCNNDNGRWTNLTKDEQYTMMTLWGICHSPLFFGGDMTKNDEFTNSLLTNEEYHHMHKYGVDAHEVLNDEDNGHTIWTSIDPETGNRYLAMFQRDNTRWVDGRKALYRSETVAYTTDGHAVNVDIEWPEGSKDLVLVVDDGGDNFNYDHGDWLNPTLVLRDGTEVALTGEYLVKTYTDSYFNRVYENKNVDHGGAMKVLGKTYTRGFSTDANAAIYFRIPDNLDVVRFKGIGAADDSGIGQANSTTTLRFMVFDEDPMSSEVDGSIARTGLISRTGQKSAILEGNITGAEQLIITVSNKGDGFAYDRADLINPVLIDAEGNETSLLTLKHTSYTSEWGGLNINKNVEGGPLKVDGQTYTKGLGMNAQCTLIYTLPKGHNYVKFHALCGYDSSCDKDNTSTSGTTMEFFLSLTQPNSFKIDFDLTLLGYGANEEVPLYDIWAKKSAGTACGTLSAEVAKHGVKLYRLGNKVPNAIKDIETQKDGKVTTNGKDTMYNLNGQATKNPAPRSIYIKNGKKYIKY